MLRKKQGCSCNWSEQNREKRIGGQRAAEHKRQIKNGWRVKILDLLSVREGIALEDLCRGVDDMVILKVFFKYIYLFWLC